MALLAGLLTWRFADPDGYDRVVAEDGPVEWATAAVYLLAAGAAAVVAWRFRRRRLWAAVVLYLLAATALFGIAGEEVSWGQRILDFEGPQVLVENNKQDEANVHNLLGRRYLHTVYILVGLYGAGVGRVVVDRIPALRRWSWLLAPDRTLRWYFVSLVVFYVYFEVSEVVLTRFLGAGVRPVNLGVSRLQEVAELGLGLGFLLFFVGVCRRADETTTTDDSTLAPVPTCSVG